VNVATPIGGITSTAQLASMSISFGTAVGLVMTVSDVGKGGSRQEAYIEVPISKGMFARVSVGDFELVSQYSWHAARNPAGNWYARAVKKSAGKRAQIWMHRLISGVADSSMVVDHIDRDGLNNVRENLRVCTKQQNAARRVSYRRPQASRGAVRQGNRWVARITVNGKSHYLGMFATAEQAGDAYHAAAKRFLGDFAPDQSTGGV